MKQQKTFVKRCLTAILTLALVLTSVNLPTLAVDADNAGVSYTDYDANGKWAGQKTVSEYTLITQDVSDWTDGWYVADGNVTIDSKVSVSGDVRLVLKNRCNLNVTKGIVVPTGASLTIYQEPGFDRAVLQTTGVKNFPGIGSNCQEGINGTGNITINGGTITAKGGNFAAGIGNGYTSGSSAFGGNITINSGTITATGGALGAGIGGGQNGGGAENIIINGGVVTATNSSTQGGAGIGSGASQASSTVTHGRTKVTINNGTVQATAQGLNDGIGGAIGATSVDVVIDGGVVVASGGRAGIGGSFSTGANGNAFIDASSISDQSNKNDWGGAIIEGNGGFVYGQVNLSTNPMATIASGKTLTIPEGSSLDGLGNLQYYGILSTAGTLINNGEVRTAQQPSNIPSLELTNTDTGYVTAYMTRYTNQGVQMTEGTTVDDVDFGTIKTGDARPAEKSITIKNSKEWCKQIEDVTLEGADADKFELTPAYDYTILAKDESGDGINNQYKIRPIEGLSSEEGITTYEATIKISFKLSDETITSKATIKVQPPHTHEWNYSVAENDFGKVVEATCTAENHNGDTNPYTRIVGVSDKIYDGNAISNITADKTNWTEMRLAEPSFTYKKEGTTDFVSEKPTEVGHYTVKMTVGEGGNQASVTKEFDITQADQEGITVGVENYEFGSTPSTPAKVTGTVKGDATPTFYYNTTNSNQGGTKWSTLTNNTLDPGYYYVYAVYGATNNYNAFTTPASQFEVTKKTIHSSDVTASSVERTYDGNSYGITVTPDASLENAVVTYGMVEGTYDLTENPKFENVSNTPYVVYYKVTARGCNPYYGSETVRINRKVLNHNEVDITITGDGSFVYDGTEKEPVVTVKDASTGKVIPASEYTVDYANNIDASVGITEASMKPVVIIANKEGGNYNVSGSKTFEIAKADPVLTVSAVADKTYGDQAFELGVTKVGESTPRFTSNKTSVLTVDEEGIVTLKGAGTARVTISMEESANYNAKQVTIDIKVKKKAGTLTVSKMTYEVTYGDADFIIGEVTGEGESDVVFTSSDDAIATVDQDGKVSIKKVGETTITLSMDESDNYNAVTTTVKVKVVPKDITVTAEDKTKVYTDKDATLTYKVNEDGLVGTDKLSDITLTRTKGEDVGTYDITATQKDGANSNYAITFVRGTYKINPKDITGATVSLGDKLVENGKKQTQNVKSVVLDGLNVTYNVSNNEATKAGTYKMTITGKGNFTGSIMKTYVIEKAGEPANTGKITTDVKEDPKAPKTEMATSKKDLMDMVMTADDAAAVADGATFEIWLEVKDATTSIAADAKKQVEKKITGYKMGQYIDIALFKKLSTDADKTLVSKTNGLIKISMTVPSDLLNKNADVTRTYAIVRNHNGKVDILEAKFDAKTGILTFETDQFSDYAIIYKDQQNPAKDKNVSPKTGNDFDARAWMLLMMFGFAGIFGTSVYRKKED